MPICLQQANKGMATRPRTAFSLAVQAEAARHRRPRQMQPGTAQMKNPGQLNCPGLAAGIGAHAVGVRNRKR
jgi:hypothetical protein